MFLAWERWIGKLRIATPSPKSSAKAKHMFQRVHFQTAKCYGIVCLYLSTYVDIWSWAKRILTVTHHSVSACTLCSLSLGYEIGYVRDTVAGDWCNFPGWKGMKEVRKLNETQSEESSRPSLLFLLLWLLQYFTKVLMLPRDLDLKIRKHSPFIPLPNPNPMEIPLNNGELKSPIAFNPDWKTFQLSWQTKGGELWWNLSAHLFLLGFGKEGSLAFAQS